MTSLEEKINHEIDWRIGEISILKSLPFLYPLSQKQRELLIKHSIPILYSLWEGFVAESFEIYAHEISSLNIPSADICPNLLTHAIDMSVFLHQPRVDFGKKVQLIETIADKLDRNMIIPVEIPTESNVNLKVLNKILERFNLSFVPENPYKAWLSTLLFLRNKLSHGESSIVVTQEKVTEMSQVVISSIHILTDRITTGYFKKTYLR
ncbi:MAG: hypothetical protein KKC20_25685 [Proteobacteria bacterium]|jgi:hypothetical protein|nr:hypothetical protein [Pseudomonadota bacterium]